MSNGCKGGRRALEVATEIEGDVVLLRLIGAIDETFEKLECPPARALLFDLHGLTRITSYGVRQWLRALEALPSSVEHIYYLSCPPVYVTQMNMVIDFCGRGKVVTVQAPYSCEVCNVECSVIIDVMTRASALAAGDVERERCPKCGGMMQLDELPESYFAFAKLYAAVQLDPAAARVLDKTGLYHRSDAHDIAPRIIKLVHDRVTFFKIVGPIDKRFRARQFADGLEGEAVIDLHDVSALTEAGALEWARLVRQLGVQVSAFALVDVPPLILDAIVRGTISVGAGMVYSVLAPYRCLGCQRLSMESILVTRAVTAPRDNTCPRCGGIERFVGAPSFFSAVTPSGTRIPSTVLDVILAREELLSRALVKAYASPALAPPRSDSILGKYKIIRALSSGGMAEVFLAVQKGLGGFEKSVALKRVSRQILERRHLAFELFLNEAKIAAKLNHPNIAQIFEVGEEDGLLYLAMEYVHGKDLRLCLRQLFDRGELMPLDMALYVTRQVALALHHAFSGTDLSGRQLKAVHRDVSPHNIVIAFDGTVKLVDFGVAISASTRPTERAELSGKFSYMAPEQIDCKPLDSRCDLYSLGVVLYQACTNARPFPRGAHTNGVPITPPSQVNPRLPPEFDRLLEKLLAHDPEDRFAHGSEVAEAIDSLARSLRLELKQERLADLLSSLFPAAQTLLPIGYDVDESTPMMRKASGMATPSQPSSSHSTSSGQRLRSLSQSDSRPRPAPTDSLSSQQETRPMPLLPTRPITMSQSPAEAVRLDAGVPQPSWDDKTLIDARNAYADDDSVSLVEPMSRLRRILMIVALAAGVGFLLALWLWP